MEGLEVEIRERLGKRKTKKRKMLGDVRLSYTSNTTALCEFLEIKGRGGSQGAMGEKEGKRGRGE